MIARKQGTDPEREGTACPMREMERCAGVVCAWWVTDGATGDGRACGHCAVMDVGKVHKSDSEAF